MSKDAPDVDLQWSIDQEMIDFDLEGDEERGSLVAHLLINDVIWVGWPREDAAGEGLFVTCNDSFAYACADLEPLRFSEIHALYRMWRADPVYGSLAWCMKQRKEMPLRQHAERMRSRGWDLDKLVAGQEEIPASRAVTSVEREGPP